MLLWVTATNCSEPATISSSNREQLKASTDLSLSEASIWIYRVYSCFVAVEGYTFRNSDGLLWDLSRQTWCSSWFCGLKLGFSRFKIKCLLEKGSAHQFFLRSRPKLHIRFINLLYLSGSSTQNMHQSASISLRNISRTLNSLVILSPLLYSELYEYLLKYPFYPQITRFIY